MHRVVGPIRDVVLWGVPIIALIVAVFVFNLPLWFAVPLAGVLLAALYFLLNSRTSGEQTRDELRQEVQDLLRETRDQIGRIRALAPKVQKQSVRDQILKLSVMADNIVAELQSKPETTLMTASRLKYTFAQTKDILTFYSDLVNNRVTTTPEKRALLTSQVENNVLDELSTSLHDFAVQQDQNEVVTLEATIRTLENTLKLEGLS